MAGWASIVVCVGLEALGGRCNTYHHDLWDASLYHPSSDTHPDSPALETKVTKHCLEWLGHVATCLTNSSQYTFVWLATQTLSTRRTSEEMKEPNTSVEKERLPLSNSCYVVHRYTVKEQCSLLCKPTSKSQTSHVMTRLCWTTYGSGFALLPFLCLPTDLWSSRKWCGVPTAAGCSNAKNISDAVVVESIEPL